MRQGGDFDFEDCTALAFTRGLAGAPRLASFARRGGFDSACAVKNDPASLRVFHFPLHHPPQRAVNARLVMTSIPPKPRQHIGVQPQRNRLLDRLVELHDLAQRNRTSFRWFGRRAQAQTLLVPGLAPRGSLPTSPPSSSAFGNSLLMFHVSHYTYKSVRTQS